MPSERGDNQIQTDQGSYAARWLRDSRDDVPQTDKPLRPNSVVQAIMSNGNSTNGQVENQQQGASGHKSSESAN